MKNLRLILVVIFLVCAAIFLGDFLIDSSRPFSALGAGVGCLIAGLALIVASVREK